ncbi:hypothetical protein BT93_F0011 [Corymbia citriodora subsp. variegata]|nr:hypothetical protein BT93_F0011 [Corymbia citriodora subsp. variegata]
MALALATFTEKDNCNRTCGNMNVPFPFGLDESCAWNSKLVLNYSHATGNLSLYGIPVLDVSVESGTMTVGVYRALDCYDKRGLQLDGSTFTPWTRFGDTWHYTVSDTRKKLTVLGCDTLGLISDAAGTFGRGCFSYCGEDIDFTTKSICSGIGCCQTSIPKRLRSLNISLRSLTNYTAVPDFSSCGSAFILDQESFNVSNYKLPIPNDIGKLVYSKVVPDWVVKRDLTCKEARSNRSSYPCGTNSNCSDFKEGNGYRCFCKPGYTGNPYTSPLFPFPGCIDIDECQDPNTPGNYTCNCPFGMTGDGKIGCQTSRLVIIAAERYFRQNGGEIFKNQRVKIFTKAKLAKATNNYNASNKLGEGGFASVYRGRIDGDILVAVKKPRDVPMKKPKDMNNDGSLCTHNEFQHEINIISQVNHNNLVKLLGISLETKVPLLVYEFIPNGTLYHHIHDKRLTILQSWKNRLRIALEAALALEYLHFSVYPPIIHSDVKTLNILLDENYSVKVSDFRASILISPGQTRMAERVQGTIGYLDPEYLNTGELTMKSDVYSFGVVLVELLTGKTSIQRANSGETINMLQSFICAMENRTLVHIINIEASNEARKCLNYNGVNRPTMREVAEQLARINKNLWADQRNNEETQSLLDETRSDSLWTSISEPNKLDSTYHSALEIQAATNSSRV